MQLYQSKISVIFHLRMLTIYIAKQIDITFSFIFGRHRLQPNVSDHSAAQYMVSIIRQSFLSFRTRAYDMIQYHQNEIPY